MIAIEFYLTASGRSPVAEYVQALPLDERAEIDAVLEDLAAHGLKAPLVSMRQIEGKLWELRIPPRTRIFYVMIEGTRMILLHAYKKQSQKAPPREIETARRRMAAFI
jgi:phage-related protein